MSTYKYIDRFCYVIVVITLLGTILFMNGEAIGISSYKRSAGYESKIFDTTYVHTLDIVIEDWDGFIKDCEDKEYELCTVVIDNEAIKNVGIRAKGNTSLSSVSAYGNDRYSFKLEVDRSEERRVGKEC